MSTAPSLEDYDTALRVINYEANQLATGTKTLAAMVRTRSYLTLEFDRMASVVAAKAKHWKERSG